ncbi:hypothetical protein [Roseiconus nitratireducens]|uniref:hypothetical protein n=1 Tax=Roseiconus nitratireducens TaxID=2605748 RepID=UPI001231D93C|nr:hypothetical protein [Roseiconus nitratireducens]
MSQKIESRDVESNQQVTAASNNAMATTSLTSNVFNRPFRRNLNTQSINKGGRTTVAVRAQELVNILSGEADPLSRPREGSNEIKKPWIVELSQALGHCTMANTGSSPIQTSSAKGSVTMLVT